MEQVDRQFEFHRLAHSWPQHRWWRPLLTALLGVAFYLVLTVLLLIVGVVLALSSSADIGPYLDAAAAIDLADPVIFAFTLASLILMIPALALAVLIVGPRPLGLLSSVAGRIRWRWLGVCAVAALSVFLVSLAVSTGIGFLFPEEAAAAPVQQDTTILLVLLALSLFAVPFQAAAEEYVFRGFLMQAIGSWLRHPAFAILLPVPLFVLGHGYDPLGQADVAVFAVVAGWLTWRTGGLEAAIAVHAINNMTIFVLGAFGLVDVNSTDGSVSGLVVSVATMAVTTVVIVRLADRRGIARTRTAAPLTAVQRPPYPASSVPAGMPAPFAHAGQAPVGATPWAQGPALPQSRSLPRSPGHAYDPSQYDAAHYAPAAGPAPASSAAPTSARSVDAPAASAGGPSGRSPVPRTASGSSSGSSSAAQGSVAAPSPAPGRDYTADRHPSGPAHPPGPGHPSGTAHPGGPGYPGTGSSASA
ncbi:CPBP family intramembrane glutamic endopeptidase [Arthrobacter sp. MDT1-48-3]